MSNDQWFVKDAYMCCFIIEKIWQYIWMWSKHHNQLNCKTPIKVCFQYKHKRLYRFKEAKDAPPCVQVILEFQSGI